MVQIPSNRYFGDDATLTVEHGGTAVAVAKARNVMVRAEAEHVELFSTESVTREDVKRREVRVVCEMEFVEFDEEFAQLWLGGGTAQDTINDTTDVAVFDVTLEIDMTDHDGQSGSESLKAAVENVHFPEMPLASMTEGEYTAHNVTGRGDAVTYTKETIA